MLFKGWGCLASSFNVRCTFNIALSLSVSVCLSLSLSISLYLSIYLSARASWYQAVGCIYLLSFIQVLIDLYPTSKEKFNNSGSLIECTDALSLEMAFWPVTTAPLICSLYNNFQFESFPSINNWVKSFPDIINIVYHFWKHRGNIFFASFQYLRNEF